MRKLTHREVRLPAGGRSQEFRTLLRHDIPRWEEPSNRWTVTPENTPKAVPRPLPEPVPLHWLPCSDEWPELF